MINSFDPWRTRVLCRSPRAIGPDATGALLVDMVALLMIEILRAAILTHAGLR
jgi:hypothetical protein